MRDSEDLDNHWLLNDWPDDDYESFHPDDYLDYSDIELLQNEWADEAELDNPTPLQSFISMDTNDVLLAIDQHQNLVVELHRLLQSYGQGTKFHGNKVK